MENETQNQLPDDQSPDDPALLEGASPLCPQCLTPVEQGQYYCSNCGSDCALNPNATYMPFVRIKFEVGTMVRAISFYPALALGLVAIAYPIVAIFALPIIISNFIKNPALRTPFNIILTAIISLATLAMFLLGFKI